MSPHRPARFALLALVVPLLLGAGPCRPAESNDLTAAEAGEALDEVAVSTQALTLTSGSVEITTDFTLGQGLEAAAAEIRDFVESQLPCAAVTVAGATLAIEYGANPGSCTYRGQTYRGTHRVTLVSVEPGAVVVDHAWDDFRNQTLTVTGTARVTWTAGDALQRTVAHDLQWTRLADGRGWTGTGERTQTPLAGGLAEGIREDGDRSWTNDRGLWLLDIAGVEARWEDPVPQAGTYTLTTPAGKLLTVAFEREDADTIAVVVAGGARSFTFRVSRAGTVTEPEAGQAG